MELLSLALHSFMVTLRDVTYITQYIFVFIVFSSDLDRIHILSSCVGRIRFEGYRHFKYPALRIQIQIRYGSDSGYLDSDICRIRVLLDGSNSNTDDNIRTIYSFSYSVFYTQLEGPIDLYNY
jgi:hypothetical protein